MFKVHKLSGINKTEVKGGTGSQDFILTNQRASETSTASLQARPSRKLSTCSAFLFWKGKDGITKKKHRTLATPR
jgi:hypothetical protein